MPQPPSSDTWRLAYIGMEFAAGPMAGGLVGYWIDARYETSPWGLLIGALVGLGVGSYLFIKESLRIISRNQKQQDRKQQDKRHRRQDRNQDHNEDRQP